jgi:hypothetical protein
LFAFSTEAVVFVQTAGSFRVTASNLSRPFLFNFFDIMVSIIAFLVLWTCLFGGMMVWLRLARWMEQCEVAAADARLRVRCRAAVRSLGPAGSALGARCNPERHANACRVLSATHEDDTWRRWARKRKRRAMSLLTFASVPFICLSLVASALAPFGTFGLTDYNVMSSLSWTARLPFFIPKSAAGITELDQMFALCVGVVALLYSLLHAFRSQRREEEIAETENRLREAEEVEARWQGTMSLALSLLQLLDERLDQAVDEREREALLERRNRLLDGMSGVA